jgi:signal transduction histidine kinase/ActR/RegA family two-component response regulator
MRSTTQIILLHYGGAVLFTALAVVLRWLLDPWVGDNLPLVTLYGAIAAVVWFGGYRPALLAVALGFLASDYLFMEPRGSLALGQAHQFVELALYLLTCSFIVGFGEAMRRASTKAKRNAFEAQVYGQQLQKEVATRKNTETALRAAHEDAEHRAQESEVAKQEVLRLNQELQRRADELQTILDLLPIGVALAHDPECRRITHNPYMSELLNVPSWVNASLSAPENERPTSFTNYRNGVEVPTSELPMQRASTGVEVRDMELDLAVQGRDPRSMLYQARPLFDEQGKVRGSVGVCLDITDRKQIEKTLRQSEQRLAAELEAMTRLHALSARLLAAEDLHPALDDVLENAIRTCGADFGNVQLFNPQVGALEIVAQRGFQQDFLDYFRLVRIDEGSACAKAMQSGRRIIIEDVNLDPDYERHRPVAAAAGYRGVQSTPLKRGDGSVVGMLSTHFRLPHRPSDRDERLLDLYAGHAADLVERFRYEQALEDADRRKDEFLATLAHELRNPLAPMRSAVELLQHEDSTVIDQVRDILRRQLDQMVRLIDDLLDVSRISQGKVQVRKEQVELADVVGSAVETVRPLIDAQTHELTVAVPPEAIYLNADPTRLAQVFLNLLNNAAKYTEPGGHIWLSAARQDGAVVVSVRDNGIGIAPEHRSHIFEMFSQVSPALERSHGGLGIGLSLVRGLVELHGGSVEAKSDGIGKGSEFSVRLPIVDCPGPPESPPAAEEVKMEASRKRRILTVDDNRDAADTLALMLKMMGHETCVAYDGPSAVETAATFQPEVMLMDIGLPKMNGYEAARHIRQQPWGKEMLLIALTGWGQEEDKRRALDAGFDYHVTKPVDPAALEKLLSTTTLNDARLPRRGSIS